MAGPVHVTFVLLPLAAGGLAGIVLGLSIADRPTGTEVVAGEIPPAPDALRAAAPTAETRRNGPRRPARTALVEPIPADEAPVDVPQPATSAIVGHVVDSDGRPLGDVVVRGSAIPARDESPEGAGASFGAPPSADDAERLWRRAVAEHAFEARTRVEARTAADGSYRLDGLIASPYLVQAWREGWAIQPASPRCWDGVMPGGVADFTASPLGGVELAVVIPDGTCPERASVQFASQGEGVSSAVDWRPDSRRADLAPGVYDVTATAGPAGAYRSAPLRLVVPVGRPSSTVTLRLEEAQGIIGRLRFPPGDHAPIAKVTARPLGDEGGGGDGSAAPQVAVWAEDGAEYALAPLAAGSYDVRVKLRGDVEIASATVRVAGGLTRQDFTLPAAEYRDTVVVWLRGPDGAVVHGARITAGWRTSQGTGREGETGVVPQPDGSYRVAAFDSGVDQWLARSDGRAAGERCWRADDAAPCDRTWCIRASSPRYGSVEATYSPAATRELNLQFQEPATVEAVVEGYEGSGYAGRLCLALQGADETTRGASGNEASGDPGADGHLRWGPLVPGAYELCLYVRTEPLPDGRAWYSGSGRWVARFPVVIRAGSNRLPVAVPSLHQLVVTLEGADAGSWLSLVGADGSAAPAERVSPAEWTFSLLTAGSYRLVAASGEMAVTVPGPERTVFRPHPFDALRVRRTGQPELDRHGVAQGDLVVAIDGTEIQGRLQAVALVAAARTHDRTVLTIQRDGRRFDVEIDARNVFDRDLEPAIR